MPVKQLFEEVEIDDNALSNLPKVPTKNDPEWTSYILGTLNDGEKDKNGYPNANGLKRLVNKFVGEIVSSKSSLKFFHPYQNEAGEVKFSASAEHELIINGMDVQFTYCGVGGANEYNADKPYAKYPESLAATRAYVRALRDALNLNCVAAEEISSVAEGPVDLDESASSTQRGAIKTMAKKLKINVDSLLLSVCSSKLDDKSLTKEVAKQIINKLNKFQCGEIIPEELK